MSDYFDVISVGEAKIDVFMTFEDANKSITLKGTEIGFRYGGKIPVEQYDLQMGGNAANVNVGLSRLGFRTSLFAETGDDGLSIIIQNSLAKEKINLDHIIHDKDRASSLSVIVNFKQDRTIFSQHVKRPHKFVFGNLSAEYVFLTSMGSDWQTPYLRAFEFAKKNKIKIAFNPGGLQLREGKDLVQEILKHTDILFLNKEEAEQIIYGKDLRDKANEMGYLKVLASGLAEMGVQIAVITNGRKGSYVLDREGNFHHEGLFPGPLIERTGAGDGYAAGFLAAILKGLSVPEAMKWGALDSTSVVAHVGAQSGLLTKKGMEKNLTKV